MSDHWHPRSFPENGRFLVGPWIYFTVLCAQLLVSVQVRERVYRKSAPAEGSAGENWAGGTVATVRRTCRGARAARTAVCLETRARGMRFPVDVLEEQLNHRGPAS